MPEALGQDAGVDRLLGDAGIVRNGKKIVRTIENAREIKAIAKEHGGIRRGSGVTGATWEH